MTKQIKISVANVYRLSLYSSECLSYKQNSLKTLTLKNIVP